ncbi:putative phage tail protein [Anaeromassilibacillus sp. An200]|uniref:putative phage tail protein n=1 Tax=Anaeromassilibacillus sp. An200 TaxID=1965587 RepID=UPI000B3AFC7A|nr:putative phage tail protein [Anaeromassilibacillus sp. An200]OUP06242.1 hypothetical protein B5F35_15695 [Anaeromassilibacillus sp. An200]
MYRFDLPSCQFLPEWYRRIKDFQEVCRVQSIDFDTLSDDFNAVADSWFFPAMDVSSVQQWEQSLGILANPQTETLEFRRARLINRLSTRPPFTLTFLYQKLDELIGPGQWEVNVDYANYTLYIKSSAIDQSYAIEVSYTVNRIKPAHIVYINQPFLAEGLALDETVNLTKTIYHYKLGAWGLGILPFASADSQGAIVIPSQKTVQQQFLNDTAAFVGSNIVSARINEDTIISNLTKTTTSNVVKVQYSVTAAETTLITQLELLNAKSETLTSAPVYIPVADPVILEHIIPVQEAINSGN